MKSIIKLILVVFGIINFTICSGQSDTKNEIQKADSIISSYAQKDAPGMAVGIIKDGKVIYKKTYGLANLENRVPVTDSTAFDIASVSKQFTAFIALQAEEEGKLSFNDDIRMYLPELKHLPYKISIRQLANHTHGLPDFTSIKKLQGFGDEFHVTNTEAVKTVLAIKNVNFRPGDEYKYNNTGFILLAEILHRIYKKDFNEILKDYIFKPLNMNNTMVVDDPEKIIRNKAESYQKRGSVFSRYPLGQMENGSSNIFMTLDDLCKWAVNFQKPSIGSREIYDKMQQNTWLNTGEKIEYGLGLQTGKYKGLDIVFHGGGTAGYRSYILHIPAYKLSIILVGNRNVFDGLFIAYKLVDLFLENHQIQPPYPQKMYNTAKELRKFAGTYEIDPGSYLDISTDGKNLYLSGDNTPFKVMGDNQFGIPAIPTGRVAFRPESITLYIGDFTFNCKKRVLKPLNEKAIDLNKFVGFYRNKEFNTIYQLVVENNKLIARHPINPDIRLYFFSLKSLYSYQSFFGQLDFKYNRNNKIIGFLLSGGSLHHIEFEKIE
nr:serine hydrolase [uncultured Chryseobacterium sp.]